MSVIEDDEERQVLDYHRHRDSSADGRTVGALVFARNLVSHELLMPVEVRPNTYGGSFRYGKSTYAGVSWRWKRRAQLGNPTDPRYGRDEFYDTFVADHDVDDPLEAAERFFRM
ncbi:MAG TPA: hypothetical protein VG815_08095 [Chloroflexota bacterium]|nr:hypothetical protein [Chloroflexota bacterium]